MIGCNMTDDRHMKPFGVAVGIIIVQIRNARGFFFTAPEFADIMKGGSG